MYCAGRCQGMQKPRHTFDVLEQAKNGLHGDPSQGGIRRAAIRQGFQVTSDQTSRCFFSPPILVVECVLSQNTAQDFNVKKLGHVNKFAVGAADGQDKRT